MSILGCGEREMCRREDAGRRFRIAFPLLRILRSPYYWSSCVCAWNNENHNTWGNSVLTCAFHSTPGPRMQYGGQGPRTMLYDAMDQEVDIVIHCHGRWTMDSVLITTPQRCRYVDPCARYCILVLEWNVLGCRCRIQRQQSDVIHSSPTRADCLCLGCPSAS